ncbi:MAG: hypothetical protein HC812_09110 [Leptolyngbya sp. RL_3_1]|nr:hypothetical protein [Leptolyngbya sp. RL_3_1]
MANPTAAPTPSWVKCLNLPALEHEHLATPPKALAQQRDWPALKFLLTRLLNPDLDVQLATGGLRVKLIERADLLHIMVDGPVCPRRQQVVPAVVKQIKAIAPNRIEGIRIYGRRAGQSRPAWNYGTDFQTRARLIPEAETQFAATDAYVGDLLAHPPEETHGPDLTLGAVGQWLKTLGQQGVVGTRHLLLQSQFFVPSQGLPRTLPALPERDRQDALKIGLVWGVIGLLLAIQGDWLLGQWLNPPSAGAELEAEIEAQPSPSEPPDDAFTEALSNLDWGNGESLDDDTSGQLTGDTFTGGTASPFRDNTTGGDLTTALLETSPYPSFRSEQMDQKLALYHQRLQVSGPPDVLIIGSSRALRGIDPAALRQELATLGYGELDIFNFGVNGSTAQVVDLTLRRILTEEQLPRLVLWADGARAFNSGRIDITYNGIIASEGYRQLGRRNPAAALDNATTASESPDADPIADSETALEDEPETLDASLRSSYQALDQQLSDYLGRWSAVYGDREGLKVRVQEALLYPLSNTALFWQQASTDPEDPQLGTSDRPLPDNSRIDFDGFLAMDVRFNPATYYQLYARVAGTYDSDYRDFELAGAQAMALQQLVQFAQTRNLPLIFVNTPLTDEYLDGYRMAAETDFLKFMVEFSATAPEFIFRDLGQIWPQRYDYFSDPSHLNRYGAYQVSRRIAQDPMIPWPRQILEPEPQAEFESEFLPEGTAPNP